MSLAYATEPAYRMQLADIIERVVKPLAGEIDRSARFPREAMEALAAAGLLGLISDRQVGGLGLGPREAIDVIERLAQHCASTAMVTCMHYAAVAVLEAHASPDLRAEAASGRAVATLAFSESGSRSQFWAPVSTATPDGDGVRLDALKSWVTSAGEANLFVWSSRPLAAAGASTIWLVPADAPGLSAPAPFEGLGLRGNCSSPVAAEGVHVPASAMLGPDGAGFDVMMGNVLPVFLLMSAASSLGVMEAATRAAAAHVSSTRFGHTGEAIADLPTVRAYIARMRVNTDLVRGLLTDAADAAVAGREDTMLRLLEVKAGAGELATEVTDLAMRVCGGAAYRREVAVERYFRDARAATVMAPTTDVLYEFIGRIECGMPLF